MYWVLSKHTIPVFNWKRFLIAQLWKTDTAGKNKVSCSHITVGDHGTVKVRDLPKATQKVFTCGINLSLLSHNPTRNHCPFIHHLLCHSLSGLRLRISLWASYLFTIDGKSESGEGMSTAKQCINQNKSKYLGKPGAAWISTWLT